MQDDKQIPHERDTERERERELEKKGGYENCDSSI